MLNTFDIAITPIVSRCNKIALSDRVFYRYLIKVS